MIDSTDSDLYHVFDTWKKHQNKFCENGFGRFWSANFANSSSLATSFASAGLTFDTKQGAGIGVSENKWDDNNDPQTYPS